MPSSFDEYLEKRVDDQIAYFDQAAIRNQKSYKRLKLMAISCNILTTMTIALAFTVPESYKLIMGIIALILSTIVLATYQIEEFASFGAKWEKFRLVAEQLKSERFLYRAEAGRYTGLAQDASQRLFVETNEGIIRGTDIAYFSLMVEPGKRLEKRLTEEQGRTTGAQQK
jgi:Protein of unknown function (DUF4231)